MYIFVGTLCSFALVLNAPLYGPFMHFSEISACVRCPKYWRGPILWSGSNICQGTQVTLTLDGLPQVVNTVICHGLSNATPTYQIASGLVQLTDMRTIKIWNLPSWMVISEVYSSAYQVLEKVSKTRYEQEKYFAGLQYNAGNDRHLG
jgi:hypothetical protein